MFWTSPVQLQKTLHFAKSIIIHLHSETISQQIVCDISYRHKMKWPKSIWYILSKKPRISVQFIHSPFNDIIQMKIAQRSVKSKLKIKVTQLVTVYWSLFMSFRTQKTAARKYVMKHYKVTSSTKCTNDMF